VTAAIYARKSTEQHVADEQKSVTRQLDHARAFAVRKGWTIADAHIYVDDGISGAEFENRPGFVRLLQALKPAPFTILIVSELSRLGREQLETGYALKRLALAGVRVFTYLDDREVSVDTATNKFMLSAGSFGAELEQEKARQRAHDTSARKARAGHVTGGKVFGYDNVRVDGHVERRINETQAVIVRKIFDLCASGVGYTRLAKQLNAEQAAAPLPQQERPAGWSPSTVNEILHRDLYRGQVVWNKTQKRNTWGQRQQHARPAAEWLHVDRPELRIVSEAAWAAAHARLSGIRTRLATVAGIRSGIRRDIDSKYLLSGFARCATCGGTISALSRSHGRQRAFFYGCLAHQKRGATVCDNALVLPVDRVNDAVLTALAGDVLRPAIVTAIIDGVFAALKPATVTANVGALRADLRTLDQKIAHLTAAVENGAALAPLVSKLQARQTEREALLAAIAAAEASGQMKVDRQVITRKVLAQVATWRALVATNGRQLLREVLDGPLRFEREGKTYRFAGNVTTGRLIAGLIGIPPLMASPTGFEPVFWP
jgi:site-specific DNA recombinase